MKSIPISSLCTIEQKIDPLLQQGYEKPVLVHDEKKSYVVKFTRREKGRIWREWSSAMACWLLFQVKIRPSLLHTGSIQHEASRLRQLRAQHLNVPKIYINHSRYIVMEYCGECVEKQLRANPHDQALLYEIVENLIHLHQGGQWHGGAQVRNLTLKDGIIYRIDFEENIGNAMPLHLAQAYDMLLCFHSLSPFLKGNKKLGIELLSFYLDAISSPEMHRLLLKVDRYLMTLRKLTFLFRKKSKKSNDIKNMIYFSDLLNMCLKSKKISV